MKFNLNLLLFLISSIFLIGLASAGNYNLTLTGNPDYLAYDGVQPNVYLAYDGNWSSFGNSSGGLYSWSWGYFPSPEAIANSSLIKSAHWNIKTDSGYHNFTINVTDCYSPMANVVGLIFEPNDGFYGDCLSGLVLFGNTTDNNVYENTFVYEIENDTIENVVITNPSVTDTPIYQVLASSGAGFSIFMNFLSQNIFSIMFGLMVVVLVVIIGFGIIALIKGYL